MATKSKKFVVIPRKSVKTGKIGITFGFENPNEEKRAEYPCEYGAPFLSEDMIRALCDGNNMATLVDVIDKVLPKLGQGTPAKSASAYVPVSLD